MKTSLFQGLGIAALCLSILLSGCAAPLQPVSSSTPGQAVPATTAAPLTPTWTPAPTDTPAPTASPTIKPTMTRPPSATPTLSPEQAKALVEELMQTNGGCDLPCWWGFTPGETAWMDAKRLFKSLRVELETNLDHSQGVEFDLTQDILTSLRLNFVVDSAGEIQRIGVWAWSGTPGRGPDFEDANYQRLMSRYALERILPRMGTPAEIYVYYNPTGTIIRDLYHLLLFYPNEGVFLRYSGVGNLAGGQALLCPIGKSQVDLWMWPAQKNITAAKAYLSQPDNKDQGFETALDLEKGVYLPLQDATSIDVDTFYEMFSQPGSENPCLQTPVQMWVDKFKP